MLNVMSLFRSNNKNICLVTFMLILDTFHRRVLRTLSNTYDGTLLRKFLTTFNRRCLTIWICLKHKMHKETQSSYIGVIFRVSLNTQDGEFSKNLNFSKSLTIFAENSALDIWQGYEYASDIQANFFIGNTRLKLAKNQAKAKQHSDAELSLF